MTKPAPLDASGAELAAWTNAILERLRTFLDTLPDQPAQDTAAGEELAARLREDIPENGEPLERLLDRLFEEVIPCAFNTAGPGYFAYIPGGGLPSAAAAELLASVVNRFTGLFAPAPPAVELETQVLRWLAQLMGLPAGALGVFTTGGSVSNLLATVSAREAKLGQDLARGCTYLSTETHHSMEKALRVAGIPPGNVRRIAADDRHRIDLRALAEAIRRDREHDLKPFLLVGNAGTVNTGAIDPLDRLAEIAASEGLWYHVDGAYGAPFRILPELVPAFRGIERADSLTLDPHKGFFLPYGTGVLLVRNVEDLRRAHASHAAYLPAVQDGSEHLDFAELSPELSRDWRGIRLWLPFKLHGVSAFREALREKRRLALVAEARLRKEADVELAGPCELSLFAFRQRWPGQAIEEENARNRDLLERINASRRVMLTGTRIRDTYWLRLCVLHLRSDQARLEEALSEILGALATSRR